MILAGDIGGTKTHLALFKDVERRSIKKEKTYASRSHQSLEEIVQDFVSDGSSPIEVACFGVAGPVIDQVCKATNLPWTIEAKMISSSLKGAGVFLINDLEANAWGISKLQEGEMVVLNEGNPKQKGNQALLSAGTGLGEAGLYFDGKKYHPFGCEGGHCNFAPTTEEEIELWRFLKKKYGHVSYERVLCGAAIRDIYEFLIVTKKETEDPQVADRMKKEDATKVISDLAIKNQSVACVHAINIFVSIYGAEAGNVALKFLSTGGLFIGGGIAPKIIDVLKSNLFIDSYLDKGRFKALLSQICVRVIINENTALLGAAQYAQEKVCN